MPPPEAEAFPTTFYSWFPGEDFLAVSLPDYEKERRRIVYSIIVVAILFLFLLPKTVDSNNDSGASSKNNGHQPVNITQPSSKQRTKKCNRKQYKKPKPISHHNGKNAEEETHGDDESTTACEILTILYIFITFGLLFFSNNNLFPARTILVAPLFTKTECQQIIDMAHAAAQRNAEDAQRQRDLLLAKHLDVMDLEVAEHEKLSRLDRMLEEPPGWKKDRHDRYPTTDLNLVTDPFTFKDRKWLANKLNGRLAPLVERSFGIFRGSIRANDMFVVRYDASVGQPNLREHKDDSNLSFNVLLNDEFEGGGTRFHSRDQNYVDHHPEVGEAIISPSDINHEGLTTTEGTRYILVGFNSIDEKDPLTGEITNLSYFSSRLNFSWLQVRFKDGYLDTGIRLFLGFGRIMTNFLDRFAPFRSLKVVDAKDVDKYFEAMDQAMEMQNQVEPQPSRRAGYASWFQGQQIDLDVFGDFRDVWESRRDNEHKFRGEL